MNIALNNNHPSAIMLNMMIFIIWYFWRRPQVNPLRSLGRHIDTAVTHRHSKIIMPIGPMEGDAIACKVTHPGHTR